MSTSANPSRTRPLLAGLTMPRPRLTVVPRVVSRAPRMPFLVLVVVVLATGLVGLLLLNTSMERGAYQVTALRDTSTALQIRQQALQLQVAALQDPQMMAEKALRLGMVENPDPAFISLATGTVLGHSVAGVAGNQFDIGTKIGPGVDRLAKVSPIIGGEANGAGLLVHHRAPQPHHPRGAGRTGATTQGGDTGARSTGSRQ